MFNRSEVLSALAAFALTWLASSVCLAHETGAHDDGAEHEDADHRPSPYDDPKVIATGGNGIGSDPDGDTNPATNTRALSRIGDAAEASFDPPYQVVTFEAENGHGDAISDDYAKEFGLSFSGDLKRQVCDGPRHSRYDSLCTYLRAPSGDYAAVYEHRFNRPLRIEFAQSVCVAAMAIYPTGGKEGETFEVTIQGYDATGSKIGAATSRFDWTQNTFRWRHMAGAYFLEARASAVDVSVRSLDPSQSADMVRFLIDDVAFIEGDCALDAADAAIRPTANAPAGS